MGWIQADEIDPTAADSRLGAMSVAVKLQVKVGDRRLKDLHKDLEMKIWDVLGFDLCDFSLTFRPNCLASCSRSRTCRPNLTQLLFGLWKPQKMVEQLVFVEAQLVCAWKLKTFVPFWAPQVLWSVCCAVEILRFLGRGGPLWVWPWNEDTRRRFFGFLVHRKGGHRW